MPGLYPPLTERYRTVRPLEPGAAAPRTLLKHATLQSAHVAHLLPDRPEESERDAFAQALLGLRVPHLAPVEDVVLSDEGTLALITPYFGQAAGLVTLEGLAASRAGRISPDEIEAAADHILHALDDLHGQCFYNGPLDPRQVLVDRQGRVQIEQFGWVRIFTNGLRDGRIAREDEIRAEIRSVMVLLFRCLTGLDSRTMGVSPGQVVSSLDPFLDEWLSIGLKEGAGFESAAQARAALPENRRAEATRPGLLSLAMKRLRPSTGR